MDYEKYYSDNSKNQIKSSQEFINDANDKIIKLITIMDNNKNNIEFVKLCNLYMNELYNSIKWHEETMQSIRREAKIEYLKEFTLNFKNKN